MLKRRGVLKSLFFTPLVFCLASCTKAWGANAAPIWAGFGLNGGADETRFSLLRNYVKLKLQMPLSSPGAFVWLSKLTEQSLKKSDVAASKVDFKENIASNEGSIIGFAHDFDVAVALDLNTGGGTANKLYVILSGVVLSLVYEGSVGWRVLSSFPFICRSEFSYSDAEKKNLNLLLLNKLPKAFDDYANAFVKKIELAKFNATLGTNFFAKVSKASIHEEALTKLKRMNLDLLITPQLIGYEASSSISNKLNIPLLPFQDNDVLSKRLAVKFTDSIQIQGVNQIPDPDLYFEIALRDIEKNVINSSQKGITIIRRRLYVRIKVFDAINQSEPIINQVAASVLHEDKIPLNEMSYDKPDRDLIFYDYLLYHTLDTFFGGISKADEKILASVDISYAEIKDAISNLNKLCIKVRG